MIVQNLLVQCQFAVSLYPMAHLDPRECRRQTTRDSRKSIKYSIYNECCMSKLEEQFQAKNCLNIYCWILIQTYFLAGSTRILLYMNKLYVFAQPYTVSLFTQLTCINHTLNCRSIVLFNVWKLIVHNSDNIFNISERFKKLGKNS